MLMHLLRNLFFLIITPLALLLVAAVIILQFYAEPYLKKFIENDLAAKSGMAISVSSVKIEFLPPVKILINDLQIQSQNKTLKAQIEKVEARLYAMDILHHLPSMNIHTSAIITRPTISYYLLPPPSAQAPVPPSSTKKISMTVPPSLKFQGLVEVQDGTFQVNGQGENGKVEQKFLLTKIYSQFTVPDLDADWDLSILTTASVDRPIKVDLPVDLKSRFHFDLDTYILESKSTEFKVAGLSSKISGNMNILTNDQNWNVQVNIPDLAAVPNVSIPGHWTGNLESSLMLAHKMDWSASGAVHLRQINGQIDLEQDGLALHGGLNVDLESQFSFNKKFTLQSALGNADLSNLSITYKDLFKKPSGTALVAKIDAKAHGADFELQDLNAQLAQLHLMAKGFVATTPGASSHLSIQMPRANLGGLEKIFPVIQSPIEGAIQINANLSGDLQNPERMLIDVSPLTLERVKSDLKWNSKDETLAVEGPVLLDGKILLKAEGQNLKSSALNLNMDLTDTRVFVQKKFNKARGSTLRLELHTQQKGQSISFTKANLISSALALTMAGTISNPLKPNFNLQMKSTKVDLTDLSRTIPPLQEWKLTGFASADVKLTGTYDFAKGASLSPMALSGQTSATLPSFRYVPTEKNAEQNQKVVDQVKAPPSEPLLPSWPIFKAMNLKNDFKITKLFFKDLPMDNVHWNGLLHNGHLSGTLNIQKVFDANVNFSKMDLPLLTTMEPTLATIKWTNLNTAQALDWTLPTWKGLISGVSNGDLDIKMAAVVSESTAKGNLNLKNGFLSTLKFDQMANEKLSKIPGVGGQSKLSTKGVAADISSQFEFKKGVLALQNLHALTPEKNELYANGMVNMDKTLDMKGKVSLSNPPIQGSILEANSDSQGRLMLPVHISGSVLSPQLNIAEETIKELLSRTAQNEGNKLKKQAEARVKTEVQKQVDQHKSQIQNQVQDQLQKGIKGILGQ